MEFREALYHVRPEVTELSVKAMGEMLGVDATCVSRSVSRVEGWLQRIRGSGDLKMANVTSDHPLVYVLRLSV